MEFCSTYFLNTRVRTTVETEDKKSVAMRWREKYLISVCDKEVCVGSLHLNFCPCCLALKPTKFKQFLTFFEIESLK